MIKRITRTFNPLRLPGAPEEGQRRKGKPGVVVLARLHSCEGDAGVSVTRFHLSSQPRFRCHAGVLHETAGGRARLEGPRDGNRCGPRETGGLRAGPAPVRASRRGGADFDLPRRRLQENGGRTQITWGEGDATRNSAWPVLPFWTPRRPSPCRPP